MRRFIPLLLIFGVILFIAATSFVAIRNVSPTEVSAVGNEVLLFDQEVQFTSSDNGFHILHANGQPYAPGVPSNWNTPQDYFHGNWQYRIQILNHPSGQNGRLQMCLWNMPGFDPENCAFNIHHTGVGVYTASTNPSIDGVINGGWARIVGGPLDFISPINYRISTILRGPNNCVVTTKAAVDKKCPELWPSFEQMRFRLSVVMVPEGDTFSGWGNYGFDDTGTPSPSPSAPPPTLQITPYPSIPQAATDCFHTCVWDTSQTPYCKTRNSNNMCGVSADPVDCAAITIPFICAYASFDCQTGYCQQDPPGPISRSSQPIYCDTNGDPTTAAATGELYTAIGCVSVNSVDNFLTDILPLLLSIAGGFAMLLIVYASYMIKTSAGDPRRLQIAKELLTAAVAGLILVIFAIVVLRIISTDILRIPGLI